MDCPACGHQMRRYDRVLKCYNCAAGLTVLHPDNAERWLSETGIGSARTWDRMHDALVRHMQWRRGLRKRRGLPAMAGTLAANIPEEKLRLAVYTLARGFFETANISGALRVASLDQRRYTIEARGLMEAAAAAIEHGVLSEEQRVRLAEHIGPLPDRSRFPDLALRNRVLIRDRFRCLRCGSQENLHMDHIVPFSHGGPTTFENLQTLCGDCNIMKGATTADYRLAS